MSMKFPDFDLEVGRDHVTCHLPKAAPGRAVLKACVALDQMVPKFCEFACSSALRCGSQHSHVMAGAPGAT